MPGTRRRCTLAALALALSAPACKGSSSTTNESGGGGSGGGNAGGATTGGGSGGSGGSADSSSASGGGGSQMQVDASTAKDVSTAKDAGTPGLMEIKFATLAGSTPVDCKSDFADIGNPAASLGVGDMRFFVYDVRLIDDSGNEKPLALTPDGKYQTDSVALLDFEDGTGNCSMDGTKETNERVRGQIDPGTYKGIAFSVGLPDAMNHADPTMAKAPLDTMAMHWSWADGYRFLRLDEIVNGAGFDVHLGSAECNMPANGDVTCKRPNRPAVKLMPFDPDKDQVVLDLATLLADSDLTDEPGCIAGGTDDTCAPIYKHLGLDATTGEADASMQDAFKAMPR